MSAVCRCPRSLLLLVNHMLVLMADKLSVLMHILIVLTVKFTDSSGTAMFLVLRYTSFSFNFTLLSCRRHDISEGLRKLHCRSLIFVGDTSPFHSEALHITSKLDRRFSALVEVCAIVQFPI